MIILNQNSYTKTYVLAEKDTQYVILNVFN